MESKTLLKAKLFPILQKHGYELFEESKNNLRFQAGEIKLNVVFNPFDRSFLVEVANQDNIFYPLNDYVVKHLFNYSFSIEQGTIE